MKPNPAVDAYIRKAAPFARPILEKLRALFHKACPDIGEAGGALQSLRLPTRQARPRVALASRFGLRRPRGPHETGSPC